MNQQSRKDEERFLLSDSLTADKNLEQFNSEAILNVANSRKELSFRVASPSLTKEKKIHNTDEVNGPKKHLDFVDQKRQNKTSTSNSGKFKLGLSKSSIENTTGEKQMFAETQNPKKLKFGEQLKKLGGKLFKKKGAQTKENMST